MAAFNAAVVGVAVRSDHISSLADAEQVGEAKVLALLQVLVVQTRFKTGHDGPTGTNIVADLLALLIAEHGYVRQKQCAVFADPLGIESVLMYKVERESAVEERRIDPVCRLAHVIVRMS